MSSEFNLYWGDSHTNLHSRHLDGLDVTLQYAREMLDFWPIAYYSQETRVEPDYFNGFPVEDWHPQEQLDREWKLICDAAAANNIPGEFVVFSGYEWQGDATSGDHNVFYLEDHQPLIRCDTLSELYSEIRTRGIKAYANPHHTAYNVGIRAKDWSVHENELSPFAEVFSSHGCSESDEEWIGLRINAAMGPGVSGGTIEDGLDAGHRFGIICSNDSHQGFAGTYGVGLMACYAEALTRESLWEAFAARRVYGVTGDRMALEFSVNDAPMGSEIQANGAVHCCAHVRGCDAIDRIELIRNNRVLATYCHNGTWNVPDSSEKIRCKLRVEVGWGTLYQGTGFTEPRQWEGRIEVIGGQIVSIERCWTRPGQSVESPGGTSCGFTFTTQQGGNRNWQANVFEIEARPSDIVKLRLEGKAVQMSLLEAMSNSRIIDFINEAEDFVEREYNIDPGKLPRRDRLYYLGHKCKIHRAIPDAGLNASLSYDDTDPPSGVNHYRVRVTQRNKQVAWSSPIWVENS